MAERHFEADLESWFAEAPGLPDAARFADRVTGRLERNWAFRRVVIGGLGLVGGLIGGAQVLDSGLLARVASVRANANLISKVLANRFEDSSFAQSPFVHGSLTSLATLSNGASEALWMSVAIALVAIGLLIDRAVREI